MSNEVEWWEAHELPRLKHQTGPQAVLTMIHHARAASSAPVLHQFIMALLAGGFITVGAALSVFLSLGVTAAVGKGFANLLMGLGFGIGFSLVVMSSANLFTEVNVALPALLSARQHGRQLSKNCSSVLRFWAVVFIGNYIGTFLVALLLEAGDTWRDEAAVESLSAIVGSKLRFKDDGTQGWFRAMASAIIGNWLIGMASWIAKSARTITGKLALFFPVIAFVTLGVQHSPANMGYFSLHLVRSGSEYTWAETFWWNIVPAAIGNMIGAFVLVSLSMWMVWGRALRKSDVSKGVVPTSSAASRRSSSDPPPPPAPSMSAVLPQTATAQTVLDHKETPPTNV